MGQLAEYHLNYPIARWRYIFEAKYYLYDLHLRLMTYGTSGVFFMQGLQALSNFSKMRYCCVPGWLVLLLDAKIFN